MNEYVALALGMRIEGPNVVWLDENGQARSARPASELEQRMWTLLTTPQAEWPVAA